MSEQPAGFPPPHHKGHSTPPYRNGPGRGLDGSESSADFLQLFMLLRRRIRLVAIVVALTMTLVGLFVGLERPLYRSTATLRLAHLRRALTVGVEEIPAERELRADPLLSMVELLQGRAIVGAVVDSLGLRLQPIGRLPKRFNASSGVVRAALGDIQVSAEAQEDTLLLLFGAERVTARGRRARAESPYGVPLAVGPVQFTVPSSPGIETAKLAVRSREEVIDEVRKDLAVVRRKSTDIVDITYTDPDPHQAQRVANLVVRTFQASDAGSAQAQAQRRADFLEAQLRMTATQIAEAEAALSGFRSGRSLGSSGEMLTAEQARLTALDTRRGELEANRNVYETFLKKLNTASDGTRKEVLRDLSFTPELAADPVVGRVSQQVLVYQSRLDSLVTGPLPAAATNPDVIQLKELISSTQEELVRALRAHLASIDAQRGALDALRARAGASIQRLPATKAEEVRLERQVEALRTTADRVRQEYENARMAQAIPAGDAQVVDWAPVPYKPAGIPPWAKLGLGLVLGLALGTGAAGLAEGFNTSIRRPEDLERDLKLRDLGVIPPLLGTGANVHPLRRLLGSPPGAASGGKGRFPEVVADSAPSLGSQAFRMLYTGLMFEWGEGPRTILVTSASPQEGKTLIAANLGATFAREGARVLLIDCDLWRPRLHKVFGVALKPGLTELLTSEKSPPAPSDDSPRNGADTGGGSLGIRETMVEGLSVLTCGAVPEDPTVVLKAHRLRSLLTELAGHFDLIILDTPPVLVSADAPLLAPLTDGAILVVRAGQTNRASAERAYQHLMATGAHFLGAVLNDPAGHVSRYGNYYYAYGYAAQPD